MRSIRVGAAMGMDRKCISSLSWLCQSARADRRIQRQIHGESNGASRSFNGYPARTQPAKLSQFLPSAFKMAVYRHQVGKYHSHLKKQNMQKNLDELSNAMNEMVTNGQLVEAAEKYYAPNIRTVEFDGRVTEGKQAAMKKLNDFVSSIQKVNEIALVRSASGDNASFSEFRLNIEMKDGSVLDLYEIVRSLWENGQVTEERYFKG